MAKVRKKYNPTRTRQRLNQAFVGRTAVVRLADRNYQVYNLDSKKVEPTPNRREITHLTEVKFRWRILFILGGLNQEGREEVEIEEVLFPDLHIRGELNNHVFYFHSLFEELSTLKRIDYVGSIALPSSKRELPEEEVFDIFSKLRKHHAKKDVLMGNRISHPSIKGV